MPAKTAAKVLRWESPPHPRGAAKGGGRSRWEPLAAELVDESGRWAVVYEGDQGTASTVATLIRSARVKCFLPSGSYQSAIRVFDGRYTVYARYVGEAAS